MKDTADDRDLQSRPEIKPWEELTFADDYIFCKVMEDEGRCRQLLKMLLGIDVKKISKADTQDTINTRIGGKGIRLDVYVEDSDRVFDIEMQTTVNDELPKRVRYYQSAMDMDLLNKGQSYTALKESFVIFICTKDPFGRGLPVYTFENICLEDKELGLNDKTCKIFLNASAYNKEDEPEIRAFLQFISSGETQSEFTRQLDDAVRELKIKSERKDGYMNYERTILEARIQAERSGEERGFARGEKRGIALGEKRGIALGEKRGEKRGIALGEKRGEKRGEERGRQSVAREMALAMKKDNFDIDDIARYTHLSVEEINRL